MHVGGKHACDFYVERNGVCNCQKFARHEGGDAPSKPTGVSASEEGAASAPSEGKLDDLIARIEGAMATKIAGTSQLVALLREATTALSEARTALQAHERFADWLVSLDFPGGQDRKTVTLTAIINKARSLPVAAPAPSEARTRQDDVKLLCVGILAANPSDTTEGARYLAADVLTRLTGRTAEDFVAALLSDPADPKGGDDA
jgi:hypothetical protein